MTVLQIHIEAIFVLFRTISSTVVQMLLNIINTSDIHISACACIISNEKFCSFHSFLLIRTLANILNSLGCVMFSLSHFINTTCLHSSVSERVRKTTEKRWQIRTEDSIEMFKVYRHPCASIRNSVLHVRNTTFFSDNQNVYKIRLWL